MTWSSLSRLRIGIVVVAIASSGLGRNVLWLGSWLVLMSRSLGAPLTLGEAALVQTTSTAADGGKRATDAANAAP